MREMSTLFAFGERLDKEREKALLSLELLISFWRDMLLLHCGSKTAVNSDMSDILFRESARRSRSSIMDDIDAMLKIRQAIQRNANVRLALDMLCMKLAA